MTITKKGLLYKTRVRWGFLFFLLICVVVGCASSPSGYQKNTAGPQVRVDPGTIRLGVARLSGSQILFKGKGFEPGDSVFINLLGVKKDGKETDIPIADAQVDKDGSFIAEVGMLPKINEILRAEVGSNEKMETVIIISQPPIPEGTYTVRAVSMESDKTADTELMVRGPSVLDKVKDWLGALLGKIEKK